VNFNVVSLVIVVVTASERKFEMSYEIETGTAQNCRCGKIIKKCMLKLEIQTIIPQHNKHYNSFITVLLFFIT
jgi:hypothetical protein